MMFAVMALEIERRAIEAHLEAGPWADWCAELDALQEAVEAVANGDFDRKVEIQGDWHEASRTRRRARPRALRPAAL